MIQFMICGLTFVGLVGFKLLLPSHVEEFNETVSAMLHQNMDVQAVFSTVGRMAAGEADGEDLVRAVFSAESAAVPAEAAVSIPIRQEPQAALELLRESREVEQLPAKEEQKTTAAPANIQYDQQNLPESVSMRQMILGFSYSSPIHGTLTSGFGYRTHPVSGQQRFHYGLDLAAEKGTAIGSFADGTVTAVGEGSSYGKYCIVEHEGGFETLYAHCDTLAVTSGTKVRQGQLLGTVGDTGMTTGSHLHFELHHDGIWLNPIYYVETT